ncbi:MAG: C45 family autoproteolytic acyltransferase/hydrolase, partial [Terriglobales bacterium]
MASRFSRAFYFLFAALLLCLPAAHAATPSATLSAAPGYSFQRGGWTYVHLQGTPAQIGYEHGLLLAPQIADFVRVLKIEALHSTHRDWQFYRDTARTMLWPRIPPEYQTELRGIARGVKAAGGTLDLWDIVALNGDIELTQYY